MPATVLRRLLLAASLAALAVPLAGTAAASRAAGAVTQRITLYSVATEEQFINNADDRARGHGNNPFGNFKDTSAVTKEAGAGPFPGDEAIFTFDVYADAGLSRKIGYATYTCQYGFNKNAFCDAAYTINGSGLIAVGGFNFDASSFSLAVTGGTGRYSRKTGELQARPGPGHSQRLAFVLDSH